MSTVPEAQLKIAQDGELDPLVKLLRHTDENVRSLAQKAVSMLSSTDSGVLVAEKNGFAPFIELTRIKDEEVRSKAVWSVAILAANDENQQGITGQLGWERIMGFLKDKAVEVQCGGITLMGNLALLDENKEHILQKNGVDVLMTLLRNTRDIIVKRAIVTALSNIVDADNAIEVFDDDSLSFLITLLDRSEDERLLSGVVHTISNIANAEDAKFNKHIVRKSLRRLIDLLHSQTDVIQKGAVMALNGISSTSKYQYDIIKQGGLKKMASLLSTTDDEELMLGLVLCINNMAQNESNHDDMIDLHVPRILNELKSATSDPNILGECEEVLRAVNDGILSGRQRGKSKRRERPAKNGIKENVRKIIEVLIDDPQNQDRLRDSGVIPHLITLIVSDQQNEELKGLALDALTMLSINNSRNQNDIAIPDKSRCLTALENVIQNSMSPPKILVRAVRLVGALCWKNKLVQGLASDRNIIPSLVTMLDSYDNNLKKAALTALACIAEDNEVNKTRITSLGTDRVIKKLIMKETHPDSLVAAAAQAIAALAKENATTQAVYTRAVTHMVTLFDESVRSPSGTSVERHIVQEQLCAALFELGRNNKAHKEMMWKGGLQRPLTELLNNQNASSYSLYNALALLWECAKSGKRREQLALDEELGLAIRPLLDAREDNVRDAANRLKERLSKSAIPELRTKDNS